MVVAAAAVIIVDRRERRGRHGGIFRLVAGLCRGHLSPANGAGRGGGRASEMLGGWFLLVLLAPVSASVSGSASAVVTAVPVVLESDGVCVINVSGRKNDR